MFVNSFNVCKFAANLKCDVKSTANEINHDKI